MKKLILIVICSLIVYGFLKVNESLSDKMYSDCMEAGKQSEETCYKYAYLQQGDVMDRFEEIEISLG